MKPLKIAPVAIMAAALCISTIPAVRAADTTQFNVKLTIQKSCTITAVGATDVNFNAHAFDTSTPIDADGSVTALCTPLTPYAISLDAGNNATGDVDTRRMKNIDADVTTNNYVSYQLYRDAAHSQVWGNTAGAGGNVVAGTGNGAAQAHAVHGRIDDLASNNAAAGDYLDVITASITY